MNLLKLILVIFVISSFYGCATMSEKECMSSDWYAVGFEDGNRGYDANQFSKHHKACTKHGITADFKTYQSGRQQGLQEFCKPNRAFQYGSQGKHYAGVCPIEMESEFQLAYQDGKRLYKMQSDIRSVSSEIRTRDRELDETESKLATASDLLVSEGLSVQQRELLLDETLELTKTREYLEEEIANLEHEKAGLERRYANYRESMSIVY